MKKFFLFLCLLLLSSQVFAQTEADEFFARGRHDGIVEANFPADTLLELAAERLWSCRDICNSELKNFYKGITNVSCDVTAHVLTKTGTVKELWNTYREAYGSSISFHLVIDVRPGKYRYTLSGFNVERWKYTDLGETTVKSGSPRILHSGRMAFLNKKLYEYKHPALKTTMKSALEKSIEEVNCMIDVENRAYDNEYKAVVNYINWLKNFAVIESF